MSRGEEIERLEEESESEGNIVYTGSSDTLNKSRRATWCRICTMFVRSRSRDQHKKRGEAKRRQYMGGEEKNICPRRGRTQEIANENVTNQRRHNRLSWACIKDRFIRLNGRTNRTVSRTSQESNITIDIEGHRREDSPMVQKQNRVIGQSEPGSIVSSDGTSGCLALKSSFRETRCCIPRMIHKVVNCTWYWGNIDRFEAAVALQTKADGYFLLRKSAHPEYLFTISFKRFNKTMHVRIESGYSTTDGSESSEESIYFPWILSEKFSPTYAKLLELIEHCGEPYDGSFSSMPLLVWPSYRTSPFSLKHLARASVYKWCNYNSIDSLQIPEELKLFLKEFGYICN